MEKTIKEMSRGGDVIVYKLNDKGESSIESKLSPKETAMHLFNAYTSLIFTYTDLQIEKLVKEGTRLVG